MNSFRSVEKEKELILQAWLHYFSSVSKAELYFRIYRSLSKLLLKHEFTRSERRIIMVLLSRLLSEQVTISSHEVGKLSNYNLESLFWEFSNKVKLSILLPKLEEIIDNESEKILNFIPNYFIFPQRTVFVALTNNIIRDALYQFIESIQQHQEIYRQKWLGTIIQLASLPREKEFFDLSQEVTDLLSSFLGQFGGAKGVALYSFKKFTNGTEGMPPVAPEFMGDYLVSCSDDNCICWLRLNSESSVVLGLMVENRFFINYLGENNFRLLSVQYQALESCFNSSFRDFLTGAFNKRALTGILEKALSQSTPGVLVILDLDKFKQINDTLGHQEGDRSLEIYAAKIMEQLSDSDFLVRLGGDEFAVILQGDKAVIEEKIKKLLKSLTLPTSVGMAFLEHHTDIVELLKAADKDMYCHKQTKSIKRSGNHPEINDRWSQNELVQYSLVHDWMDCFLQPIVNSKGEVCSAEVLARINHPAQGLILPRFFNLSLDDIFMAREINRYIIARVMSCIDKFPANLKLAINISPVYLENPLFIEDLEEIFSKYPYINRSLLEFEITETAPFRDIKGVLPVFKKLQEWNIDLVIDDFGVGYGSLSYLQNMPIAKIKLDAEIVRHVTHCSRSQAIAQFVKYIGEKMNIMAIAEGIESFGQLNWLQEQGYPCFQGRFCAPEMEINKFLLFLAQRNQPDKVNFNP